jgi:two-component system heavy metal sensor histidine kinase CusS
LRTPLSLTTRLGILFALVAGLTFAAVGAYLYQSLATQLAARDDNDLIGRMGQIRHFLEERADIASIVADPHQFHDAAAWSAGLVLSLRAADGTVLLQNHDGLGPWPQMNFIAAEQVLTGAMPHTWRINADTDARALAAWASLGGDGTQQVQVILAHTTTARYALLAAYRSKMFAAVFCGALLAALLGYALVWRGLLPLRQIVQQAGRITAERLATHLDVRAAPAELQILVQAFNAMLDRLHQSFQRLSQFSADLAHDLRTPINNLMVQNQVALSQVRSVDEYQTILASNIEEYERLSRMVESVLFLARADNAQVALNRQHLDAGAELQRIADYFEGVAADAGVTLAVSAKGGIDADPILFRRAVNNLVANAIRYTPKGGVITLAAQAEEAGVGGVGGVASMVSVTNPGPGIDAEHIPKLFDRFYRADPARSNVAAGSSSGLGLCIVRSIMGLHGGRAEVECSKDGFTEFRLLFPLRLAR